jgi:D-amino-acid oxidase
MQASRCSMGRIPNQTRFLIQGEQYRLLKRDELPAGHESGFAFTSVCINTAIYLPYLLGQCLKNGAIVKRGVVGHVSEAAKLHHSGKRADIVVNATGLSSGKLGGVLDPDVYPARGQIVLVRNEAKLMVTTSGTDDGADEANYIMQRAAGKLRIHSNAMILC